MAKTAEHRKDVADFIASRGSDITLHEADPGTTGASKIATTPPAAATTWGTATDDGTVATKLGSAVTMTVPASKTVTHFGVWSGSKFVRGGTLDASITVGASGAVAVQVTPRLAYE